MPTEEDLKVDRHLRAQVFWSIAFLYLGFIGFLCWWLG